jgi:hypothetical protein
VNRRGDLRAHFDAFRTGERGWPPRASRRIFAGMHLSSRLQDIRSWRQETLQEIDRAQTELEILEKQIGRARERVGLLDQLLAVEGELADTAGGEDRPSLAVARPQPDE